MEFIQEFVDENCRWFPQIEMKGYEGGCWWKIKETPYQSNPKDHKTLNISWPFSNYNSIVCALMKQKNETWTQRWLRDAF